MDHARCLAAIYALSCGMFRIRIASDEDASSIARIHVESWCSTYRGIVPDALLAGLNVEERATRWRELLDFDVRILVAEQNGEVVGFASGGRIREPLRQYDAELFAIYLLQAAQRNGLGTALLIELGKCLDRDGFQSMAAWVLDANKSTGFYERSGAVRISTGKVEMGGVSLPTSAYGWSSLKIIINSNSHHPSSE